MSAFFTGKTAEHMITCLYPAGLICRNHLIITAEHTTGYCYRPYLSLCLTHSRCHEEE